MKPDSSKIEYRCLEPIGLRISIVGWGNWVNNQEDQLKIDSLKVCLEHGVKFFEKFMV